MAVGHETPLSQKELAHIVSLYDEEVAAVDQRVGELLAEIDTAGLRDDTLVIVTGDHGEELYEHGFYFFHVWSIYDSVLHIPLVMRLPDRLPAGRAVSEAVESIDIAPTILSLLGLPRPERFEGDDLASRISAVAKGGDDEAAAFSELGTEIFSLRTRRWHYIYNPKGFSSPADTALDTGHRGWFWLAEEELYDLDADPREARNLAAKLPERARILRERLLAWMAGAPPNPPSPEIGRATRAELEALGYVE